MQNILITWVTSWIWYFLASQLKNNSQIIWIWRQSNTIEWIEYFQWDIQNQIFLKILCEKIDEIDYLILNAGVWYFGIFHTISLEHHRQIIQTNLLSNIMLTSLLWDKIKIGIIFIGSIASKKSGKYGSSYQASKFWLRGFAMSLKNEYPSKKIHFINPSIVETDFHKNSSIEICWKYRETKKESILEVITNILEKKEHRFEIDI